MRLLIIGSGKDHFYNQLHKEFKEKAGSFEKLDVYARNFVPHITTVQLFSGVISIVEQDVPKINEQVDGVIFFPGYDLELPMRSDKPALKEVGCFTFSGDSIETFLGDVVRRIQYQRAGNDNGVPEVYRSPVTQPHESCIAQAWARFFAPLFPKKALQRRERVSDDEVMSRI